MGSRLVSARPQLSAQGALADHAPVEALVAGPLQAIDEVDHRAGRCVEQRDVGVRQLAGRQGDPPPAPRSGRRHASSSPPGARAASSGVEKNQTPVIWPPAYQPSVFGRPAHHGAALRAHQVVGGDAHRPAEPRGLSDHLIQRVYVLRAADAGDRFHVRPLLEELHGEHDRAQLQPLLQLGDGLGPSRSAWSRSSPRPSLVLPRRAEHARGRVAAANAGTPSS